MQCSNSRLSNRSGQRITNCSPADLRAYNFEAMAAPQYNFPKQEDEREKCTDFLRNFLISNERRYMEQLQEISDRQRKVLEISMDDILDHRNDEEFLNNVRSNTARYLRYFEEAADKLMPAERAQNRERDVFDILQVRIL